VYGALSDDARRRTSRENIEDVLTAITATRLPETLHTFLNAAAGEGFVLDGVDAADLYIALFPERYYAALKSPHLTSTEQKGVHND
jgi:hypothetical protein